MPVSYTRKQIAKWLGPQTIAKAFSYTTAVSDVHWQHNVLRGLVQGTLQRPYAVSAYFDDDDLSLFDFGSCSCPVGHNCKHVAALLLSTLEQGSTSKPAKGVRPDLLAWLDSFRAKHTATAAAPKLAKPAKVNHALLYVLGTTFGEHAAVHLFKARLNSKGVIHAIDAPWNNVESALVKPPKFVTEQDLPILRGLWLERSREDYGGSFSLRGATGNEILEKIIATDRVVVTADMQSRRPGSAMSVRAGPARTGRIAWQPTVHDRVQPALQTDPPATLLFMTQPCWYVDANTGEAGTIDLPWSPESLELYLAMPPISLDEAPLVSAMLGELAPELPRPPGNDAAALSIIDVAPTPVLSLDTLPLYNNYSRAADRDKTALDFATVHFDYAGIKIAPNSNTSILQDSAGQVVQVKRRPLVEKQQLAHLQKAALRKIQRSHVYGPQAFPPDMLGTDDWPQFMQNKLPALREKGWRVAMSDTFSFNWIEIETIEGELQPADGGWFDVAMGITVNDRTVRLEPLLAALFQRDARWLSGQLDNIPDAEAVELKTDRNERLRLRADRLKPVVRVLIDLFSDLGQGEKLRISEWDVGRLDALSDTARWQFHGDNTIRELAQRLASGPGVRETPLPRGLKATLRPYQRQGLDWMQFLRECNLSGVLADDMGLGKTVQTLAHILAEKEAGRLTQPALIVMPTSLMHNWHEEARRFTPALNVLDLHGPQRRERFDEIAGHDLILTTYALLWRDQEMLAKHAYHLLILDEAQYVKNANSKAAGVIRELRAQHRLGLTGTPLENHLGELWSLFDFLLPGFLGSSKDFTKQWRTPIEKNGDTVRRDLLARRIRPFMLRRRKDEVATELPPKTIIVRNIELEGSQRDLYESMRAAMQEKVRKAIAKQGLARSHIIVLDALLKLRQVCCDPRLVKIKQAAGVKESAKLDLLMDMLPELIDEGRRILLFSQFTGMLELIAAALDKAKIGYVMLTGSTTDRATPIKRFTQGQVPLFLISLKAGGVGLNLTAADTVIHYDPWWNPAAENQATDRAHRIGQDKPVFVYKLITAGSIEEKIVTMQEKKAALANAILSDDAANASKFSTDDISALFEPIPSSAPTPRRKS